MGGIGPVQLLIVLAIVLLLFGTKKLRNLGSDVGSAVRGFRTSMKEGASDEEDEEESSSGPAKLEGAEPEPAAKGKASESKPAAKRKTAEPEKNRA